MKPALLSAVAGVAAVAVAAIHAPLWLTVVAAACVATSIGLQFVTTPSTQPSSDTPAPTADRACLRFDGEGRLIDANGPACSLLGGDRSSLQTWSLDDVVDTDDAARIEDAVAAAQRARGVMATLCVRVRSGDGWGHLEVTITNEGETFCVELVDAADRVSLEGALGVRCDQLAAIAALERDALDGSDEHTLLQNAVHATRLALGADAVELYRSVRAGVELAAGIGPGGIALDRNSADNDATVVAAAMTARAPTFETREDASLSSVAVPIDGDGALVAKSISGRRFDDGDVAFLSAVAGLIALARRQRGAEQDAFRRSRHDDLTGLVNREVFLERLETWVRRSGEPGEMVAVLLIDLDHFKIVNDSLGHTAGDALIEAVGERLTQGLRPGDTLARFGGDEFVVLSRGLASVDQAALAGRRMQSVLAPGFEIAGHDVAVTASVGVAPCHDPHAVAEELLQQADVALYQAKARGRERVELFEPDMMAETVTRLRTEQELREALAKDQLRVFYQPIVDLGTGKTEAVEALVRWVHPGRGLVTPAEFIPISEATGLIEEIGAWVINETCRQVRVWRDEGNPMPVSINVSPRQIGDPNLLQTIDDAVRRHDVDPSMLTIELTENILMTDLGATLSTLHALRERGVSIAIDDFGTGYSSLSYLKTLPVDLVKIDRGFVSGIDRSGDDYAIIAAMVRLAQVLDKRVVAEGVETEQQLELLRDLGCDMAQGFLFSPAVFEIDHGSTETSWSRLVLDARR